MLQVFLFCFITGVIKLLGIKISGGNFFPSHSKILHCETKQKFNWAIIFQPKFGSKLKWFCIQHEQSYMQKPNNTSETDIKTNIQALQGC